MASFATALVKLQYLTRIQLKPALMYWPRVYRNDGVGALYRGIDIELLKSAASNSVYFYVYTLLKHSAMRSSAAAAAVSFSNKNALETASAAETVKGSVESTQSLSVLLNLLIGCVAGSVTQLCVNPLNVVCTRMQTQSAAQSRSIVGTFQQVFSEGGWAAMYRYVCLHEMLFH